MGPLHVMLLMSHVKYQYQNKTSASFGTRKIVLEEDPGLVIATGY